jgi:hypothetical protein
MRGPLFMVQRPCNVLARSPRTSPKNYVEVTLAGASSIRSSVEVPVLLSACCIGELARPRSMREGIDAPSLFFLAFFLICLIRSSL